jgi:amino acid transporter
LPVISNIRNIVFLAGAVTIFSGVEVTAAHSQEVIDPKRTYPRAIFLSAAVALTLLMLGALAIAVVVPQKDLSLVAGVMETFTSFFRAHGLGWLVPVFAVLIAAGAVGELSAWIIGPAKGLMVTAEHGDLPPSLQKVSPEDVPTNILIVQGVIATVASLVFLFMPTVSSSYWILTALSILLYLLMYLLLFAAAIRLRYTQPDVARAYTVPGGKSGMWLAAGAGFLCVLFTFVVTIFPPAQIETGSELFYVGFLVGGVLVMCVAPFVILGFKKPSWRPR